MIPDPQTAGPKRVAPKPPAPMMPSTGIKKSQSSRTAEVKHQAGGRLAFISGSARLTHCHESSTLTS